MMSTHDSFIVCSNTYALVEIDKVSYVLHLQMHLLALYKEIELMVSTEMHWQC